MRVLADAQAVAQAAAGEIAKALRGGARTLVLAGGTTPRRAYELLAGMDVKWGRVTVLFGDERCVAPEDPESNYRMARESLLDRVAPATVHRMPAELGPEEGARLYSSVVAGLEPLDLVILGLGPDGHCASLFPGHRALQAPGWAVAVRGAPKPPPDRVSLTLAALRGARRVIFLATGAEKAEALRRAHRGEVPAGMIPGAEWFVDREAAAA
ncbi:MAG: 6-phosphogluconolactonase [Chloroflexi bacterium]|nr:MAG: 6-phosphogluconolactonase [Chloroflexota bacterium]TME17295.1 MAG: 6-phosphogluconolactonase [Chloroflexota bacterium]